jgi:cytochrome P450
MALLLFTSLICLTISLAYLCLKRRYSSSRHVLPEMKPHFFVGNLINSGILSGKKTFPEVLIDFQRRYGDKFMFWFGSHPCMVFCRPEHAETIYTDRQTFERSPLTMPNFDLLCPHALSLLRGAKWKRHIRVMLPMFKRAKMAAYLDTILQCADRFIYQNLHNGQVHRNLFSCCQSFTMNVIGFIGFDYDFDIDTDSPLKIAFEEFIFYAIRVMMIPWIPRWLIKLYLKLNWKYQRAHRFIREVSEKIVEEEKNKQYETENQRPKNLIASLVSSLNEEANDEQISSGLTREEMLDEVLLSILGGFGTTSAAISWLIFFLSKNPQVQQRMKEELREHNLLMTDDTECAPSLTEEKLASLIYCESVTKEVWLLLRFSITFVIFSYQYRSFVWLLLSVLRPS